MITFAPQLTHTVNYSFIITCQRVFLDHPRYIPRYRFTPFLSRKVQYSEVYCASHKLYGTLKPKELKVCEIFIFVPTPTFYVLLSINFIHAFFIKAATRLLADLEGDIKRKYFGYCFIALLT